MAIDATRLPSSIAERLERIEREALAIQEAGSRVRAFYEQVVTRLRLAGLHKPIHASDSEQGVKLMWNKTEAHGWTLAIATWPSSSPVPENPSYVVWEFAPVATQARALELVPKLLDHAVRRFRMNRVAVERAAEAINELEGA